MTIALFSDVHANLPALQAMFADMELHRPDAIYCLGDLVGYNSWPNEVINEMRRRGIPTIAGNYDEGIGNTSDACGCAYKTDEDKAMGSISIAYTNAQVQPQERSYLQTLPAHIRVSFHIAGRPLNLMLVHGSPRRINEYLFEDRDEKSLLRILKEADADILCFGHTHKPFHRSLPEEKEGKYIYRYAQ
ncbi:metallophosphoesterase family protein [Pontibacter liquoris]|uniref:metallophosphoesterase family protein n=1 Tax=Pontibacter liquoris TaxID=2905677 RepID=UPI003461B696